MCNIIVNTFLTSSSMLFIDNDVTHRKIFTISKISAIFIILNMANLLLIKLVWLLLIVNFTDFTDNLEHAVFCCCWVYRTPINTNMVFITESEKNTTCNFSKFSENYLWKSSFLIMWQLASLQTAMSSFRETFQRWTWNYFVWYLPQKIFGILPSGSVWTLSFGGVKAT